MTQESRAMKKSGSAGLHAKPSATQLRQLGTLIMKEI
jgi:hypothetical protein